MTTGTPHYGIATTTFPQRGNTPYRLSSSIQVFLHVNTTTTMSTRSFRHHIRQENQEFRHSLPSEKVLARSHGEFFTVFEALCDTEKLFPIEAASLPFPVIRRSLDQGRALYPRTVDETLLESAPEFSSQTADERSDTTHTHQIVTAVDFLWNEVGETAHLVSTAPVCHAAYFQLSQAATGFFCKTPPSVANCSMGCTVGIGEFGIPD